MKNAKIGTEWTPGSSLVRPASEVCGCYATPGCVVLHVRPSGAVSETGRPIVGPTGAPLTSKVVVHTNRNGERTVLVQAGTHEPTARALAEGCGARVRVVRRGQQ